MSLLEVPPSKLIRVKASQMSSSPRSAACQFWDLSEAPFESTVDYRFFYPSRSHREAMSRLQYFANEKNMGFALVSGEIGSGKTTTCGAFLKSIQSRDRVSILIENSDMGFGWILRRILGKLGVLTEETRLDLLVELFDKVLQREIVETSRHLLIVIDEAQDMDDSCLLRIKNLSNYRAHNSNFLSILLSGQPELRQKVKNLPQLDQRIGIRYFLKALGVGEIPDYIAHRMKIAGYQGDLFFTRESVELIYQNTHGNPRELNRILKFCLEQAYATNQKKVDSKIVKSIVRDLAHQEERFKSNHS